VKSSCFIRPCPWESGKGKEMLIVPGKERKVKETGRLRDRLFWKKVGK
jgi:hypothetical protein